MSYAGFVTRDRRKTPGTRVMINAATGLLPRRLAPGRLSRRGGFLRLADSDDGAVAVLRGECLFDSRDYVQERNNPSNLEDPFDDRRSPQHDIELPIECSGGFLRLHEYSNDR